jgi:hypothetical protein
MDGPSARRNLNLVLMEEGEGNTPALPSPVKRPEQKRSRKSDETSEEAGSREECRLE